MRGWIACLVPVHAWHDRSITPEYYFSLSKSEQADLVWDALFIKVRWRGGLP